MKPESVAAVLRDVLGSLEEVGLEYAVLGGYAVMTWGIPRATYDVDVLVAADPQVLPRFFHVCEKRGFLVDEAYRKGWKDRIRDMPLVKVNIFRDGRPITADIFLVATPFQQSAFSRRTEVTSPDLDRDVPVVTAADMILFKLMADRPKDRLDVQNILAVQGNPDPEYLLEWASRLGLTTRLEDALRESGLEA